MSFRSWGCPQSENLLNLQLRKPKPWTAFSGSMRGRYPALGDVKCPCKPQYGIRTRQAEHPRVGTGGIAELVLWRTGRTCENKQGTQKHDLPLSATA